MCKRYQLTTFMSEIYFYDSEYETHKNMFWQLFKIEL